MNPTNESPTSCGAFNATIVLADSCVIHTVFGFRDLMNSRGCATGCIVEQPITVARMRREVMRRKLLFIIINTHTWQKFDVRCEAYMNYRLRSPIAGDRSQYFR